jgi:hypothetical protein
MKESELYVLFLGYVQYLNANAINKDFPARISQDAHLFTNYKDGGLIFNSSN